MTLAERGAAIALVLAVSGCNAPEPPGPSGGIALDEGPCGRGLVVLNTDYQSTNISITDTAGSLVSESFISSASASTALSAPLSGDVVVPNTRLAGADLVVIDRFPSSVLTWIELATGTVRAQLDVSTGFAANPRDYLELEDGRAYVTRFETNPSPGAESYDEGGDVLVVDPAEPTIVGRIDLSEAVTDAPGFLPRPSRMIRFDGAAYVLLLAYDEDFTDAAPSRLVRIDPSTNAITSVTVLDGMLGCEGLVAATDALFISCSGVLAGGDTSSTDGSGLVRIDEGGAMEVVLAEDLGSQPLGFAVAPTRRGVLVNALGRFGTGGAPDTPDAILHVTADGTHRRVLSPTSRPFELGDIRCTSPDASCGRCFVTDGEAGALHELSIEDGTPRATLPLDDGIGLPPRGLGRL